MFIDSTIITGKGVAPCKGCKERHPKCHGECERYQSFRRERDEFLAETYRLEENTRNVYRNDYWDLRKKCWRKK